MSKEYLSNEAILIIRDGWLPSQGDSFDALGFGRAVADSQRVSCNIEHSRRMRRIERRIAKRDAKIAALQQRVQSLESALAKRGGDAIVVDSSALRKDLKAAVQQALGSVRMIPILGITGGDVIVEAKVAGKD